MPLKLSLGDAPDAKERNPGAPALFKIGFHIEDGMPAKKTRRKSTTLSRAPKDAIALLKAEHKEVKTMVGQFSSSRSDSRKSELRAQI